MRDPPPRADVSAEADAIDLLWANLDAPPLPLEALEEALDPGERQRAERFRDPRLRSRWIAGRGLLRHLLSRRQGCPPPELPLLTSDRGKPYLDDGLSFNLSHSGPHLLVALAPGGRIGADVEVLRPVDDLEGLARRSFAPAEVRAILSYSRDSSDPGGSHSGARNSPPGESDSDPGPGDRVDDRVRAFLRTWVRKEAFVKGVGLGVSAPLDAFEVETEPPDDSGRSGRNLLRRNRLPGESDAPWQIRSVPAPPDAVAAVAWDDPRLPLRPATRLDSA